MEPPVPAEFDIASVTVRSGERGAALSPGKASDAARSLREAGLVHLEAVLDPALCEQFLREFEPSLEQLEARMEEIGLDRQRVFKLLQLPSGAQLIAAATGSASCAVGSSGGTTCSTGLIATRSVRYRDSCIHRTEWYQQVEQSFSTVMAPLFTQLLGADFAVHQKGLIVNMPKSVHVCVDMC